MSSTRLLVMLALVALMHEQTLAADGSPSAARAPRAGAVQRARERASTGTAPLPRPAAEGALTSSSGFRTERSAGFTAGAIGGVGFAFRRFTSDGWGWQLGGLAAAGRFDRLFILGGQRMKSLNVRQRSRFYALAGAMGILDTDRYDEFQPAMGAAAGSPPVFVQRRRDEASFNVGGGLGISYETESGVGFVLELPIVFEFQNGLESVGPIPQVAVLYHF